MKIRPFWKPASEIASILTRLPRSEVRSPWDERTSLTPITPVVITDEADLKQAVITIVEMSPKTLAATTGILFLLQIDQTIMNIAATITRARHTPEVMSLPLIMLKL